ncbi:hypothetical protein [Nesterenkonia sp. K-15-9-6]|uniref:hypothetical protein n=1 Tax=Nesterenkonia sp. K-15-9-6 TaxID=3093918 RepID=UPI004043A1EC
MARTTVTEKTQGTYWLENSRLRLHQVQREPEMFQPRSEGTLRSSSVQIEALLEIVDWENDPTTWQRPHEVLEDSQWAPEYREPMETQYDRLFGIPEPGEPEPLSPETAPVVTVIDLTRKILDAAGSGMTPTFETHLKARWVTFLNQRFPERDEEWLSLAWMQDQPRQDQDAILAEQFEMVREVHDWMLSQGMTPLTVDIGGLPDLMQIVVQNNERRNQRLQEQSLTG